MITKRINNLGLPYHGLVVNNQLQISNDQKIEYPGLSTGDTQLVTIPNYPSLSRTSEQKIFDKLMALTGETMPLFQIII